MPGSINGGGYLVNGSTAAGSYKPDVGLKTNFGFNVKYNKSGTNLQGKVNIILRRTEGEVLRTYQIKSNAIDTLTVKTLAGPRYRATFTSKANLTDITDPLNPVPVSSVGNGLLQITLTDNGDPGSSDTIGITYYNKDGGLVFSNQWARAERPSKLLKGGNLQVRPAQLLDGADNAGAPLGVTITTADAQGMLPVALALWEAAGAEANLLRAGELSAFKSMTSVPAIWPGPCRA